MIAYFRLQNNLAMVVGALVGALAAFAMNATAWAAENFFVKIFAVMFFVLMGVVLGRLIIGHWATAKVKKIRSRLYQDADPKGFLEEFLPLAGQVPTQTVEYIDAQQKIAFAYEALGDLDAGLAALEHCKPEELKLHSLQASSIVKNQRMRLYLLKEDIESAKAQLDDLAELRDVAVARAPSLGRQLTECVKLGQNWLNILSGEEADLSYIQEEITLSGNSIHKAEMQYLLALGQQNAGDTDASIGSLVDCSHTAGDLYIGGKARDLLNR